MRLGRDARKRIAVVLSLTVLWSVILLVSAGELGWPRGWMFLALMAACLAVDDVLVLRRNPGLIEERGKRHSGTKRFDKIITPFFTVLWLVTPVVAGLDAVRFHWTSTSLAAACAGMVVYALGNVPVGWAMATNPHLEKTVRIQSDRGHRVVADGPYRYVRHPMYAGVILQSVGAPLILGSLWTYVPNGLIIALFVLRTALEDRTLRAELPGYQDYARRTRYRLLPGLW